MTQLSGIHDTRLVAFSLLIAVVTCYTALDLAARVTANRGFVRLAWLLGGAVAMGSGIWCMHYTGMLAFSLPIPIYYHVPTVILSLIAAIVASCVALYVVSRERMTKTHVIVGSLLVGSAIATMHYTGMAAMRLQAMHHYDRGLWTLSIVLAVAISFAGLLIIFYTREENRGWKIKLTAALVLGLAVPTMHYTAMAAVSFMPMTESPNLSHSLDISSLANLAIFFVTFLILGIALVTALVDRRLTAQQRVLDGEREMLRALIDNIPDLIFVKDAESRFVIANPATALSVGTKQPQELIGKTDFDFFPQELAQTYFEEERDVLLTGKALLNHEEVSMDSEGDEIPVLVTKVPLRDSKGNITGLAAIGRDISQRKKGEEALREAEQRYRALFDNAIAGIFRVNPEGVLLNANAAMARFMRYSSPEELLETMKDSLWASAVSPQRVAEFLSTMRLTGQVQLFELEIYCKDRTRIWISASVRKIMRDGILEGFQGMFEDITERKLLREQLLQAQKLESVGQLAAGIAHEINTPTQYIGDNVRFLKDTFHDLTNLIAVYSELLSVASAGTLPPLAIEKAVNATKKANLDYLLQEIPSAIEQTLEGVKRVSTLVSAMKEFSHPGTVEKIPLDLNHAIQSTITVARNEWKYVADMETSFDPMLPTISCQPGEINQVILNLIVNAAHAIADKNRDNGVRGNIKVETHNMPKGIEIRIEDTGSGIPSNIRTRIFDPFFTTKEIGKGTGQGLAIARSVIVDKHAGSIDFETAEGKGTTFIIRLPHDNDALSMKAMAS